MLPHRRAECTRCRWPKERGIQGVSFLGLQLVLRLLVLYTASGFRRFDSDITTSTAGSSRGDFRREKSVISRLLYCTIVNVIRSIKLTPFFRAVLNHPQNGSFTVQILPLKLFKL